MKLENLIKDSISVTDSELEAEYLRRNPKARSGEFEKNKEGFRQSYLAEKQRDALTAYVRNIQNRVPVIIEDKALTS
jgi:hypothetical protein